MISRTDKEVIAMLTAAKQQYIGIVRVLVNTQLSMKIPNTNFTVGDINTALVNFVNYQAGGVLIQPLQSTKIANLDSQGTVWNHEKTA